MIHIGKLTEGPVSWVPRMHLFGGCVFLNVWKYSIMIVLPNWFVKFCEYLGIDLIGD